MGAPASTKQKRGQCRGQVGARCRQLQNRRLGLCRLLHGAELLTLSLMYRVLTRNLHASNSLREFQGRMLGVVLCPETAICDEEDAMLKAFMSTYLCGSFPQCSVPSLVDPKSSHGHGKK